MGDIFPKFKAAVVQASSILYDRQKCLDKAIALIDETAKNGAELVALPESFIPGYPYHVWMGSPMWYHDLFKEWFFNSVEIPSKEVDAICQAAARNHIDVVIGVTERENNTCYNTLLYISRTGKLLGKHRKLMPTHVERVHWGAGDGSDLRIVDMAFGKVSGLICWEHTMDLARHAMIAQRPKVHVAAWVGFSSMLGWETLFDMSTELCSRYHAHVGECFVLNVQGTVDKQNVEKLNQTDYQKQFFKEGGGWSAIIAPGGSFLTGPLKGQEGILYSDIDLNAIADMAHWHDATGHYARPDLLSLMVNLQPYHVTRPMQVGLPAVDSCATDESAESQHLVSQVTQLMAAIRNQLTTGDVERIASIVKAEVDTLLLSAK